MPNDMTDQYPDAASLPPDQREVLPTQRKIGEGMLSDGPNGQNSTPPANDVSRLNQRAGSIDTPESTIDVADDDERLTP